MAIQTLNTIKNWFRTGLKPTQSQFWDTWDSFRHKNQKVQVTDVEGIDELLNSKTDKSDFKTINGESILGSGDIGVDGGSQDLQHTLDAGRLWTSDPGLTNPNMSIMSIAEPTIVGNTAAIYITASDETDPEGLKQSNLTITEGAFAINSTKGTGSTRLRGYQVADQQIQITVTKPDMITGDYFMATTDDITLQNVLNNNAVATLSSSANTSSFEITADGLVINTESFDGTETNGFQVNQNGISIETYKNGFQTAIRTYSTPIANTSFEFPVKEEGTYTLATLKDIPVINPVSPVSNSQSGIVDNTSLQELGGVDKLINTVRIGLGAGTTTESTAIGTNVLGVNTTGDLNTGVGFEALKANTTGSGNTAVGDWALYSSTTGSSSTALGTNALYLATTGYQNNAFGRGSLGACTTGYQNLAFGNGALKLVTTGTFNVGVGNLALQKVTTTSGNTAIGAAAGQNITGTFNVAIGYLSNGETGTTSTGNNNITIGYQSGRALTSGSNNILIENITNASITSGSNNIILDSRQKSGVTTGNNNTLIGGWDGAFAPTTSDTVALGTGAGVTRFLSASTGLTTLPTQTNALISADATGKAIITKSYSDNMGAVVNVTTSALSGTALNSAYPSAIAGFRVHCLSITGGAIVYEKTTGGWIQYSTTAVTP